MFSFMIVLLNFLKNRMSVSFPKIVVSAFAGLVLYLCPDLSCLITVSRFWCFCSSSRVIFLLLVENYCLLLVLTGVLYQVSHED